MILKNAKSTILVSIIEQYRTLFGHIQNWGGMHSHLNTTFPSEYLDKGKKVFRHRCLVIDENPVSSLITKLAITIDDLDKLIDILNEINRNRKCIETNMDRSLAECVIAVATALKFIINQTEGNGIYGLQFLKVFTEGLKESGFSINGIKNVLNEKNANIIRLYRKILLKRFENSDEREYSKDIIADVFRIGEKCVYYHMHPPTEDINLPFFSEAESINKNELTYEAKYIMSKTCTKKLPDVPVIILDATGDKDFYEQIFDRKVVEYNPSIEIKRNIFQIMDGKYSSKSLYSSNKEVYKSIFQLIKYHHREKDGIINIVTLKKFAEIKDEKGDYTDMSIERYLENKNVDMTKIRIWHYGDVKGKNEMENDKVLIIVGTPEPNIISFPKEVGCWYEGEKKIINERIIEPEGSPFFKHNYRHKDPRYDAHIRHKREYEIEQAVERLRFALSKEEKVVYLFSMIPISFETHKTSKTGLYYDVFAKASIANVIVLDAIYKGGGKVSHQNLRKKTCHLKAVKKIGFPNLIKELLENGAIEETGKRKKRVYQITQNGKEWYKWLDDGRKEFFDDN